MGCCGVISAVFVLVIAVLTVTTIKPLFDPAPAPKIEETWWGPRKPSHEDTAITPFKINVPDNVIQDLKHRLDIAKPFTPALEGAYQNYGMHDQLLSEIVNFWKTKYNWKEREQFLNQFPQFKVSIQGLRIHYLHVKPSNPKGLKVLPLLLLHGWPGSVREFYEIIPILTTPQKGQDFVFEVIAPSLPGYGFSEAAVRPGLGPIEVAVVMKNLMKRLGYEKYYLQGGDWGGLIVQHMSALFPEHVIGVHSNMCNANTPWTHFLTFLGSFYPSWFMDAEEAKLVYPWFEKFSYIILESGYMHLQATKPDTIGAALRDNPVGLTAYITEKFTTWTNKDFKNRLDGGLTEKFTLTKILDNIMIYWITESITTSVRIYSENFSAREFAIGMDRVPVKVPSGCAKLVHDLLYQPDAFLKDKYHNLIHSSRLEVGHFAAFEAPKLLAEDIFQFVKKVQSLKNH